MYKFNELTSVRVYLREYLPRMRYDHCQSWFRAPASQRYPFSANSNRLPWEEKLSIWPSFVVTDLLGNFTSFYDTFKFFYNERTDPHCWHSHKVHYWRVRRGEKEEAHFLYGSNCRFGSWNCLRNEDDHGRTRIQGIRGHACRSVQCCTRIVSVEFICKSKLLAY